MKIDWAKTRIVDEKDARGRKIRRVLWKNEFIKEYHTCEECIFLKKEKHNSFFCSKLDRKGKKIRLSPFKYSCVFFKEKKGENED